MTKQIKFYDLCHTRFNLQREVINGLNKTPKRLSPKLLYDQMGSKLFDQICLTPEYYVTRLENSILAKHIHEIATVIGEQPLLIELGCGSCQKIKLLLSEIKNLYYMPVDISKEHLQLYSRELAAEFPNLPISAICLDYMHAFQLPRIQLKRKKVIFFAGSSISNFEPSSAALFLKRLARVTSPNGGILIGVDLVKDQQLLNSAYNDAQGITAAFNKNLLYRINKELNANFEVDAFSHNAFYNINQQRIEMHLKSQKQQSVSIGNKQIHFKDGETIHTESSYKYHIDQFQRMAFEAGFHTAKVWLDEKRLFSVHYFGFKP